SYAPNRLTYTSKTAKGGLAVFSEVYFPWGWHATIDGKPAEIARVNYILRALQLPQGEHKIEMRFDPQSLHNTVTIAIISIILIYMLLITACIIAIKRSWISNL
ncbi:YfhO family protein, partial [uncultured Bacteroides sp.]